MKKSLAILLFCLAFFLQSPLTRAQTNSPDATYHLLTADGNFIMAKNYYLLTLFSALPDVATFLKTDAVLADIAKGKRDSLSAAINNCRQNGNCYIEQLKFSQAEIDAVGKRLRQLYQTKNVLGKLVSGDLIPSGRYILFQNLPPADMLVKAWEQDANGINFCLSVYAGGSKPNYPFIDSIAFTTKDGNNNYLPGYTGLLYNATSLIAEDTAHNTAFFSIPLNAALLFLEMNERTQAADYEPMEEGENKEAIDKIKTLNWSDYKYSAILVPGAGPDKPGVQLSAEGMMRCRLAAIRYQKKMAPFIIVSGGKVHPYKTAYCEAAEMKHYLLHKLHIPAHAVIIEPHARHTTTNMRNTARLIFWYGMPFNKPAVSCTTRGQSRLIGTTLTERCLRELNEIPYKNGERLDENTVEFFPLIEALQSNPAEPMDP